MKHHPVLAKHLEDGKHVAYNARSITKGELNCLPEMIFSGGLLTTFTDNWEQSWAYAGLKENRLPEVIKS